MLLNIHMSGILLCKLASGFIYNIYKIIKYVLCLSINLYKSTYICEYKKWMSNSYKFHTSELKS